MALELPSGPALAAGTVTLAGNGSPPLYPIDAENNQAQQLATESALAAAATPLVALPAVAANLDAGLVAIEVLRRDVATNASIATRASDIATIAGDALGAAGSLLSLFGPELKPLTYGLDVAGAALNGASLSLGTPAPLTEAQIAAQKQAFAAEIAGANPDIAAEEAL